MVLLGSASFPDLIREDPFYRFDSQRKRGESKVVRMPIGGIDIYNARDFF